jgi:O-antigen ligase
MLFLFQAPLRHAVIVFLCLMMFDLQRQIGGTWIYVDLSFATLLLPVARTRRMPPFWWVFVPYTAYLLIDGIPRSLNPAWYFGFAVRSIIAVIVYLACALADVEDVYFVLLGVVMIPLTVYGAYQLAIGDMGDLYNWMNPHFAPLPWMDRAYSLLWQPNFFGGVTSITLVGLIALAIKGRRPRVTYALAFVCLIGLLCSGSRGGMIGAALGICFAATITGRAKLILILIALVLTIFVAGHILDIPLIQRLSRADELSNRGRFLGNEIGIAEFLKNPIFGLGPTNFEVILPTVPEWEYTATMPVNNTYLQHLAELGILGFAAFWVPVLILAKAAWKQRNDPVVLACMCMLLVFATHGLFDYMLELGPSYLFLFYSFSGVLAGRLAKLSAEPITLVDIALGSEATIYA